MHAHPTDEELLTSRDPNAFGVFYARHLEGVERYFARRVPNRDTAADLAAETFAAALVARRRFVPGPAPAIGWLYMIAARRLVDFQRRTLVERRANDRLEWEAHTEAPWSWGTAPERTDPSELGLLRHLPAEQRDAVAARVFEGRDYLEIADAARASEASIRQRVSRGLRALRAPFLVYRTAQEVTRRHQTYRLYGGHRTFLAGIAPSAPLDCSAAASLILARAGALQSDVAWTSGRFAREWGQAGPGRQVTVWANDEHVWLEFKLHDDHGERFDPTPLRNAPHAGWLAARQGPTDDFTPRHLPGL